MNKDLSVIFITSNKVPESWAEYHKEILLKSIGEYPLIIISRKPMEWSNLNVGDINIIDSDKPSSTNFYYQLMKGAKLVKTPYMAIAEDDMLYNEEHFNCFRPELDVFGYNMNRWSVATWGEPIYSRRESKVGGTTICSPIEMVSALQEKFDKFPEGMPPMKIGEPGTGGEKLLGVSIRKSVGFYSKTPVIQFNHDYFSNAENSPEGIRQRHRKSFGIVRAYDIPYWGKASELISKFK
jgi:hypothetical protein